MKESLSLIETIASIDRLSTFSRLMGTSGANAAFSEGGDFTVFAPTNDALSKIPDKQMNALLQEPHQTTLRSILSYHILPRKLVADDLRLMASAPTIMDVNVKFTNSRAGLIVNDSGVRTTNIEAANGVIHELDTVLNYDIETFKTGPLKMPEGNAAGLPELVVPTLDAGGTDGTADGRSTNGNGPHRTGRSGRGRTFFL